MAGCVTCGDEMLISITCSELNMYDDDQVYPRVRYGDEPFATRASLSVPCRDA